MTPPAPESGLAKLADAFDAAYEAEWERVAEIAEGAGASGVADRAATIAGIRAVHAALLAKLDAVDALVDAAFDYLHDNLCTCAIGADQCDWHKLMTACEPFLNEKPRNPAPAAEGE